MDSFSINGKHLKEIKENKEVLNPLIVLDKNFTEHLVYGSPLIGKLTIVRLPYFDQQDIIPWLEKWTVTPLAVTPDRRVLIYFNLGLCWMGDFVTHVASEKKDKGIISFIKGSKLV